MKALLVFLAVPALLIGYVYEFLASGFAAGRAKARRDIECQVPHET